jgi:hypothetical protein
MNYQRINPTTPLKAMFEQRFKNKSRHISFAKVFEFYQKFMFLHYLFPDERFSPNYLTDVFWHWHMEDPVHYYEDCMKLFGRIVPHDATIGFNEDGKVKLEQMREKTQIRWKEQFHETYDYDSESWASETPQDADAHPVNADDDDAGYWTGCG